MEKLFNSLWFDISINTDTQPLIVNKLKEYVNDSSEEELMNFMQNNNSVFWNVTPNI